jgi:hypothetical protein
VTDDLLKSSSDEEEGKIKGSKVLQKKDHLYKGIQSDEEDDEDDDDDDENVEDFISNIMKGSSASSKVSPPQKNKLSTITSSSESYKK